MENVENITALIVNNGIAVAFFAVVVYGCFKFLPRVIDAYKEGNANIVSAIKEMSTVFSSRIDKLEDKVDTVEDKVDTVEKKVDDILKGDE